MADEKGKEDGKDATTLLLEKLSEQFTASTEAMNKKFEELEKKINASSNGQQQQQTETTPSSNEKGDDKDDDDKKGGGEIYTSEELDKLSVADCLADMDKLQKSLTAEYKAQQEGK